MCVQCVMGATAALTTGAGVAGGRAWLGTRHWRWLSPARLKRLTVGLLACGVVAAATVIGPGSATPGARTLDAPPRR